MTAYLDTLPAVAAHLGATADDAPDTYHIKRDLDAPMLHAVTFNEATVATVSRDGNEHGDAATVIAHRVIRHATGDDHAARLLAPSLADEIRQDVRGWKCRRDVIRKWVDTALFRQAA